MYREARRSFDKREPVVILALSMMKFYRFQNKIFMRPHPAVTAWWGFFYVNSAKVYGKLFRDSLCRNKNIPNRLAVWNFLSTFVAVFALEDVTQDILMLNRNSN